MESIIQTQKSKNFLKFKITKIRIMVGVLTLLLVGAISSTVYFYRKTSFDPQKEALKELTDVIKNVSKHMVLPEDDTPTMATVSDPEKLKDQLFFAKAKKGDKVLIFSGSQKAILYSPTQDKIIEVAPINASIK